MTAPPLNGSSPQRLAMGRTEPPASSFTAVNGEVRRSSPSHSDIRNGKPAPTAPDDATSPVQFHSHGWRSESQPSQGTHRDNVDRKKRKRTNSLTVEPGQTSQPEQGDRNGPDSPKRRMTNMDSAIDVSSPDQSEPPPVTQLLDRRPRSPLRIGGYHR